MTFDADFPLNPAIDRNGLTDGRARFYDILDQINADHGRDLPDYRKTASILESCDAASPSLRPTLDVTASLKGLHVVVVPGFLTECIAFIANCLTDGLAHLETFGARTSIAPLAGRGGCAENAARLRDHLLSVKQDGERFILVGMSKGAPDTMMMLATYPEMAQHIEAVVSLVGCVCGSPLKYHAPKWLKNIERYMPLPTCARFGGQAVFDLDPKTRTDFLKGFHWPKEGPRIYSLGAAVEAEDISKGMLPSFHALITHHPRTDGQMLLQDQILPDATVLGVLRCDHIATAMPFNRNHGALSKLVVKFGLDKNAFPREVMLEAIARQVLADRP